MGLFKAVMFRPAILSLPLGLLGEFVGTRIGSRRLQQQLPGFNQELSELLQHEDVTPKQIVEQLMLTPRMIGRRGSLRFNSYFLKTLSAHAPEKSDEVIDLLGHTKRGRRILKKFKK